MATFMKQAHSRQPNITCDSQQISAIVFKSTIRFRHF